MSEHRATIRWSRQTEGFSYEEYNREHRWEFGDGVQVPATAAREFRGNGRDVDPEQAFVAAVSACHMLSFLAICARKRIVVDRYRDDAVGYLDRDRDGRLAVTRVQLAPVIAFAGDAPDDGQLEAIHHWAHEECFIANSIRTEVRVTRYS